MKRLTLWDKRGLDEDPFADVEVSLGQVDSPRGCRRFRKTTSPDFALLDPKRTEEVENS